MSADALAALAPLFRYPDAAFPRHVAAARRVVPALESFARETAALDRASLEITYTSTFDLAPSCSPYLGTHLFGEDGRDRARLMVGLARVILRGCEEIQSGAGCERDEARCEARRRGDAGTSRRRRNEADGLVAPQHGSLWISSQPLRCEDSEGPSGMQRRRSFALCRAQDDAARAELPDHIAEVLANARLFDDEEWRELEELVLRPALAKMEALLGATNNPYRHLVAAALSRGGTS